MYKIKYKSRLWNTWRGMKERCTNPNHKNYESYRGKLCAEWYDSSTFGYWAITNGYSDGLTIDRIDPLKGYDPSNCQFITAKENTAKGNRQRRLKVYKYKDSEYTCKELARMLEIGYTRLHQQLNKQRYTVEQCIDRKPNN